MISLDNTTEIEINNGTILQERTKENIKRKSFYISFKRCIDVLISALALIILSPVLLIIALAIKLDSKGKIIFKHKRVGKNGKTIYIYKFRTMVENAEDLIKSFSPEQMEEYRNNFKLNDDPRITKVGKFLRKTSLDELPQLVNILKGDLAIIGPRPVIEEELEKYENNKEKFLSVTPGLTGYWTANGRSDISYEERMQMELFYVDNLSFKMDIKLFFKTILVVLKREGAK